MVGNSSAVKASEAQKQAAIEKRPITEKIVIKISFVPEKLNKKRYATIKKKKKEKS